MQPCRLLIADGDSDSTHAIHSLVALESDIEVVGAATTLDDAVRLAAETRPDVLLLDRRLARGGLDRALGRLRAAAPRTVVVLLLVHHGEAMAASEAGARAWLMKDASRDEILREIRRHSPG